MSLPARRKGSPFRRSKELESTAEAFSIRSLCCYTGIVRDDATACTRPLRGPRRVAACLCNLDGFYTAHWTADRITVCDSIGDEKGRGGWEEP